MSIWSLFLLLPAAPSILAQSLKLPPLSRLEEARIIAFSKKGKPRWKADLRIESVTLGGREKLKFTEKGRGRFSGFKGEVRWETDSIWGGEESLLPERMERRFYDLQGKLLSMEITEIDLQSHTARFERQTLRKKRRTMVGSFNLPLQTFVMSGFPMALRGYPFASGGTVNFLFLSNEPKLYRANVQLKKKEAIQTLSGRHYCYKLEMKVDLGMLNLFRPFIPKIYFWFEVEKPHHFVAYSGLEDGRGTPKIRIEMVGNPRSK
ncbi:MAG: hypothetical protein ACE5JX_06430 [Acidobacteriota bacterium]